MHDDATNELGSLARLTRQRAQDQWRQLDEHLAWCNERIGAHGPAAVADLKQFKSGAQFGALIGLTSRQRPSGGKSNLGGMTKRGDNSLRTLQIQGAKPAVMTAHLLQDKISNWVVALKERSAWQKAVVALANKNARILWAVMTRGEAFDANHLSVKPAPARLHLNRCTRVGGNLDALLGAFLWNAYGRHAVTVIA